MNERKETKRCRTKIEIRAERMSWAIWAAKVYTAERKKARSCDIAEAEYQKQYYEDTLGSAEPDWKGAQ